MANSDEQTTDTPADDKKAAVAAAIARAKAKKEAKAAESETKSAQDQSSNAYVIDNKSQGSELAEKSVAQSSDDKRKAAIAAAVARAKAKKLNKEGNDQS